MRFLKGAELNPTSWFDSLVNFLVQTPQKWENSEIFEKILSLYAELEKWAFQFADHRVEMVVGVLVLNILLVLIGQERKKGGSSNAPLIGARYVINILVFFAISLVEFIHFVSQNGEFGWFLSPSHVGWLWVIVNFFLYLFVVINQSLSLLETFDDLNHNSSRTFNYSLVFWVWAIGIVILGASYFVFADWFALIASLIFVTQCILTVRVALKVSTEKGIFLGITYAFLMQSFLTSTLLIFLYFIPFLIIGIIIFLCIRLLSFASPSTSGATPDESNHHCGVYYTCSHCGGSFPSRDLVHYSGERFCPKCKLQIPN